MFYIFCHDVNLDMFGIITTFIFVNSQSGFDATVNYSISKNLHWVLVLSILANNLIFSNLKINIIFLQLQFSLKCSISHSSRCKKSVLMCDSVKCWHVSLNC